MFRVALSPIMAGIYRLCRTTMLPEAREHHRWWIWRLMWLFVGITSLAAAEIGIPL